MRLFEKTDRDEFWINYDHTAGVYEIFKSQDGSDFIGDADTIQDVKATIRAYQVENR